MGDVKQGIQSGGGDPDGGSGSGAHARRGGPEATDPMLLRGERGGTLLTAQGRLAQWERSPALLGEALHVTLSFLLTICE